MNPLYTPEEFKAAKSRQLMPLKCKKCEKTFYKKKHYIQCGVSRGVKHDYCTRRCQHDSQIKPVIYLECKQCGKEVLRKEHDIEQATSRGYINTFCSYECSGIHSAAHKTKGDRRSKLERWIEQQLFIYHPTLDIKFNEGQAINAELDIYIPSLKLAFELNGIFHYEPIFGKDKLDQTKNKDKYKLHACTERGIDLCVLDTSSMRYFKPKGAQQYLDIILDIINKRMAEPKDAASSSLA